MVTADVSVKEILERLADKLEKAPVRLVGASVSVTGGNGGSVTGLSISVSSGPPGTSTVGMHVSVDPGKYDMALKDLLSDLREAAKAAETQKPAKSWIKMLLEKASRLQNQAISGIIGGAAYDLAKIYGPF